ncbi:hypothetical protein NMY22_g7536 [Coprinellus aureogranulatus]|nr:hypothetical protein NMY22_g7536 [Coprinellus aureogranulatus]
MAKEMEEMAAEVASSGGRDVAESDNGSPGQMEGDVTLLRKAAVEARALAKREREKAKEAGMLVRLKLKEIEDQVVSEVGEESTLGGQALPGKTSSYNSSDELAQPESSSTRSLLVHGSPPSPIQSSGLSTPTTQTPTTPPSRKHPRLAGIAQLVAKMFLSRHETSVRRSPTMLSTLDLTPTPATSNEPSSSTSSSDSASSLYSSSSSSDPSLTPALNSSTPSSPSSSAPSTPKASPYKYKHLWMKGVASASLRPQPPSPFAQYQKRYKFLRSSPLAKYSVVASDEDEDEDTSGRDGELDPVAEQEEQQHHQDAATDGGVGALWDDDEEDLDGGFEALRNPINWDNI